MYNLESLTFRLCCLIKFLLEYVTFDKRAAGLLREKAMVHKVLQDMKSSGCSHDEIVCALHLSTISDLITRLHMLFSNSSL